MARAIGGLHEVLVGVEAASLGPVQAYFERYGFRAGAEATFSAGESQALYGHASPLRSLRLSHGDSDHGLVRLQCWGTPAGAGLGLSSFRAFGTRWGAQLTRSVLAVMNHVDAARRAKQNLTVVEPIFASIYQKDQAVRPFEAPLVGVREMNLIRPLTRQVLFERFGYDAAAYGSVDEDSMFQASQITHFGMVVVGPHGLLDFYDRGLGLFRSTDNQVPYEKTVGSRVMFGLSPGEQHWLVDFDDPANESLDWPQRRSGRLKILRFDAASEMPDLRRRSDVGQLGYGPYTLRVDRIDEMRDQLRAFEISALGTVHNDEFGVPSFSVRAPDGYQWILQQAA